MLGKNRKTKLIYHFSNNKKSAHNKEIYIKYKVFGYEFKKTKGNYLLKYISNHLIT